MTLEEVRASLEALLLVARNPLKAAEAAEVLAIREKEAELTLRDLAEEYDREGRGFCLRRLGDGWMLGTRPEYAPILARFLRGELGALSKAALETLAVVAYRQPVTRQEVEAIRGVNSDRPLATLAERGLVQEEGRREAPGRPILYGTTALFLQHFGLNDLSQLEPLAEPAAANQEDDYNPKD